MFLRLKSSTCLWSWHEMNATGPNRREVCIVSNDDLVPSGRNHGTLLLTMLWHEKYIEYKRRVVGGWRRNGANVIVKLLVNILLCWLLCFLPLTPWGRDKLAAILLTFSNKFFMDEKFRILIPISMKFVRNDLNYDYQTLAQMMAWLWTGDDPLSELLIA